MIENMISILLGALMAVYIHYIYTRPLTATKKNNQGKEPTQ